jgi:hypothetical protein
MSRAGTPVASQRPRGRTTAADANQEVLQEISAPVRRIPGDPHVDSPEENIALSVSGGGYRAMLFHLGALWRLNEIGYLCKLERVSSVSGSSMAAGVLAAHWSTLDKTEALTQERLINWGHSACDAAMRRYLEPAQRPPSDFPYSSSGVG